MDHIASKKEKKRKTQKIINQSVITDRLGKLWNVKILPEQTATFSKLNNLRELPITLKILFIILWQLYFDAIPSSFEENKKRVFIND